MGNSAISERRNYLAIKQQWPPLAMLIIMRWIYFGSQLLHPNVGWSRG